ncbi:MAG: Hsp20/alpha crystallin family protein [Candidatus Hydrogenedentes bacterium]|nr:Hsp20/alpha crystallin family protein [Candidatus Hydrogenedentota bacterium]
METNTTENETPAPVPARSGITLSRPIFALLLIGTLAIGVIAAFSLQGALAQDHGKDTPAWEVVGSGDPLGPTAASGGSGSTSGPAASTPGFSTGTWDPFKEMEAMQRQMDQMFNQAFGRFNQSPFSGSLQGPATTEPRMDLKDSGSAYVVTLDMPGVEEGGVDVKVNGQTLEITAKRTDTTEKQQNGNVIQQERRFGLYSRSLPLPGPVDVGKMTTAYDNGVVTVTLPKANL